MTRPDDPGRLAEYHLGILRHLCNQRIGWDTPLYLRKAHRKAVVSTLADLCTLEFFGVTGHTREAKGAHQRVEAGAVKIGPSRSVTLTPRGERYAALLRLPLRTLVELGCAYAAFGFIQRRPEFLYDRSALIEAIVAYEHGPTLTVIEGRAA